MDHVRRKYKTLNNPSSENAKDGARLGRIVIELFADTVPRTAENFRCLCTGERGIGTRSGIPLHFKGTTFDDIAPDFTIYGGINPARNRALMDSIYGGPFEDENHERSHDRPGIVSMANGGPNTNGAYFFILLEERPSWSVKLWKDWIW
ncbi:unnamed protein product [Arabis nemorensis]|uniref:Peptidyl-prolyl cis-trans isomerase n=1 Tax=Arabis nemorensis TaxID=586526 RepID=A0A565BA86_9BRAS|nr:unnamed protein product [Arabis nemorensis]